MDWIALIEAARAENAHGIEMRRGKRYTTVAVRVEIMRRHAGALGVSTEIIHWGTAKGEPIVVKATVTDEAGRVLATGHAEEIRGQGQVNSTSALENAETSAIGRALAALGLSGGEFASANEMDGVERKATAIAEAQDQRKDPPFDPAACRDRLLAGIAKRADADDLAAFWKAEREALASLKAADDPKYNEVHAAFAAAGKKLKEAA